MLSNIYKDFQVFIWKKDLLNSAAGFSIGIATSNYIEQVLSKTVIPILIELGERFSSLGLPYWSNELINFIISSINWILIIIITFLIVEYVLNRGIIGIKTDVKGEEKIEMDTMKTYNDQNYGLLHENN